MSGPDFEVGKRYIVRRSRMEAEFVASCLDAGGEGDHRYVTFGEGGEVDPQVTVLVASLLSWSEASPSSYHPPAIQRRRDRAERARIAAAEETVERARNRRG